MKMTNFGKSGARIAVCASGQGTLFEAIVDATRTGQLAASVVGLVTDRDGVPAIAKAVRLKIPVATFSPKKFSSRMDWDLAIASQLHRWNTDWVVLAGFLALVGPQTLTQFPNRIVNSHPALLPKYGGAGMFGERVHEAVLQNGETETGITVHLVDAQFDHGPIIAQQSVKVEAGDYPARLAARVKAAEALMYPKILNDLVTGRIPVCMPER